MADTRHRIASYHAYDDAEHAVDALSDAGFPIELLSIVADELSVVERVTGRRTYLTVIASGAGSGVIVGGLIGWLFGVFSWIEPLITVLALALYGALLGAVVGALLGLLAHAARGGRRDFSSLQQVEASSYDLVATTADIAVAARAELGRLGALREDVTSVQRQPSVVATR